MICFFEGPDLAGKTTLISHVHRRLLSTRPQGHQVQVHDYGKRRTRSPLSNAPEHYSRLTEETYTSLKGIDYRRLDLLVDRLWVSDIVYGQVYGRPQPDRDWLRPEVDFPCGMIVHVTVHDFDVLLGRMRNRAEETAEESLRQVWKKFKDYFSRSQSLPTLTVHTDSRDRWDLANDVVSNIMILDGSIGRDEL